MHITIRNTQRLIGFVISTSVIWFCVEQLFDQVEKRMPLYIALVVTYILAAYVLLPYGIQLTLFLLRRKRIPRYTRTRDGLHADPINIILI